MENQLKAERRALYHRQAASTISNGFQHFLWEKGVKFTTGFREMWDLISKLKRAGRQFPLRGNFNPKALDLLAKMEGEEWQGIIARQGLIMQAVSLALGQQTDNNRLKNRLVWDLLHAIKKVCSHSVSCEL